MHDARTHTGSHGGKAMIHNTTIQNGVSPQAYRTNQGPELLGSRERGLKASSESVNFSTDTVTLSYKVESVELYDSSMTLQPGQLDGFDLLRGLVLNMFEQQGMDFTIPTGNGKINLDELSQEEATELVSDDGYFGIEQTSDRIVDFAVGVAGGDPTRIDAIKAGVEQGFNEALEAFGGWLPDISYDTYDAVMNKLDAWVGESKPMAS
jgi:hypothetical protein